MKTPREILLGKHEGIEPKLDALRRQFVADVARPTAGSPIKREICSREPKIFRWQEAFIVVRWHLAGLTAMWLLIAVLRAAGGAAETHRMAEHKVAAPRTVILTLKENRRQIQELSGAPVASAPLRLQAVPQPRRSHLEIDWAYT